VRIHTPISICALLSLAVAGTAEAQERRVASIDPATDPSTVVVEVAPHAVAPAPQPPAPDPYAPMLLRGSPVAGNFARADVTTAPYQTAGTPGVANVFLISGAYKITDGLAVGEKIGFDDVSASGSATKGGLLNPQLSGMYGWRFGRALRLSTGLTLALPLGSGGGDGGDQALVAAHEAASLARGGMEGSLFGVNDFTAGYAVDFAYVRHGFTAQIGTTVWTAFRARGAAVQADAVKVNSTSFLGAGYFIIPALSVGAELREQCYLSTPAAVEKDPASRENFSAAVGVRGHIKVAKDVTLRPGASYGHGIAGPVATDNYQMVQFDVPVTF
jgi:hypothetical protein